MKVVFVFLVLCLSFLHFIPSVQAACSATSLCPNNQCCSQWGYCGTGTDYCGTGCLSQCGTTGPICSATVRCPNNQCCSQHGYCGTTSEYCGTGCLSQCSSSATSTTGKTSTTGGSTTGSGSCRLSQIFSQNDFNALFPHANHGANTGMVNQHAIFTYSNLISAAEQFYPSFGCTGTTEQRKRELAAFLAQTSQETSGWWGGQPYNWGYCYSTEVGCTNTGCQYCRTNAGDPTCAAGKGYYGRGPLQISWNYNYNSVSYSVFGDNRLLTNPDQLFTSGVTAFRTSLWFWMTAQSPKPSCHDVITGVWTPSGSDVSQGRLAGFGMTTNIINGGLECSVPAGQKAINRREYFKVYTTHFGISTGSNVDCNNMAHY